MNNETNLEIDAPEGVESIWELFTPKSNDLRNLKVKRTAVFFYICPSLDNICFNTKFCHVGNCHNPTPTQNEIWVTT